MLQLKTNGTLPVSNLPTTRFPRKCPTSAMGFHALASHKIVLGNINRLCKDTSLSSGVR